MTDLSLHYNLTSGNLSTSVSQAKLNPGIARNLMIGIDLELRMIDICYLLNSEPSPKTSDGMWPRESERCLRRAFRKIGHI